MVQHEQYVTPEDLPYGTYCPEEPPRHACAGAECPHCAGLPVGRVTCAPSPVTERMAVTPEKKPSRLRHLLDSSAYPLPDPLRRNRRHYAGDGVDCLVSTLDRAFTCKRHSHWHADDVLPDPRLATFRDSLGNTPARWPSIGVPSTTIILMRTGFAGVPEVFVHQRADNGWWGFVGGKQEVGESILQCAIREAKEETGLTIQLGPLVCVDSDPTQYAINSYADTTVQYCNLTFLATALFGTVTLSHESQGYQWIMVRPAAHLPSPFLPAHRWRLEAALAVSEGGEVQVR